jgi:hypothetical protein
VKEHKNISWYFVSQKTKIIWDDSYRWSEIWYKYCSAYCSLQMHSEWCYSCLLLDGFYLEGKLNITNTTLVFTEDICADCSCENQKCWKRHHSSENSLKED